MQLHFFKIYRFHAGSLGNNFFLVKPKKQNLSLDSQEIIS